MNHLIEFKVFEATNWQAETIPSNLQNDIFDIFLELKDLGFDVSYQWWPPYERYSPNYPNDKYPHITIQKWDKGSVKFEIDSEILDSIDRLKIYLDNNGFNINVKSITKPAYRIKIEMINRKIYGDIFEKFTETEESKPLSKKELKRLKYHKELTNKIVSVDELKDYGIPDDIIKMMSTWEVINRSPYSDTFYSSTDIDWGHKPDKSYRVSDHWNFTTQGNKHCVTDDSVPNNTHISIGQYSKDTNTYKILLSLPTEKHKNKLAKSEARMKYLQNPDLIYKKTLFKERIKNGEIIADFDYEGEHYKGVLRKYTGNDIILDDDTFSGNKRNGKFQKIKKLQLSDKDGNKIEDILK